MNSDRAEGLWPTRRIRYVGTQLKGTFWHAQINRLFAVNWDDINYNYARALTNDAHTLTHR